MPRTKSTSSSATSGEVLTLSEAAAYLRIADTEVIRLVETQSLPGRRIGEQWRFLKGAIQQWLGTPTTGPDKQAQLSVAGAWKDDPHLEEELRETYARRGRPADGGMPWSSSTPTS